MCYMSYFYHKPKLAQDNGVGGYRRRRGPSELSLYLRWKCDLGPSAINEAFVGCAVGREQNESVLVDAACS